MKLMEFTKEEKEMSACYIAKNIIVDDKEVNILGGFYQGYSIAIEIEDASSGKQIEMLSMNVNSKFLSSFVFENQIVINHNILDKLKDYNGVIEELTHMKLNTVKIGHIDSFILTLNLDNFEKMVHFMETMKESKEQQEYLKVNL